MSPVQRRWPLLLLALLPLVAALPAADHPTSVDGAKLPAADAQALLEDLKDRHPELREALAGHGAKPLAGSQGRLPPPQLAGRPGRSSTSTHTSSGTSTVIINGKQVYNGPGSSVSATVTSDGTGTTEKVVVDGREVPVH